MRESTFVPTFIYPTPVSFLPTERDFALLLSPDAARGERAEADLSAELLQEGRSWQ